MRYLVNCLAIPWGGGEKWHFEMAKHLHESTPGVTLTWCRQMRACQIEFQIVGCLSDLYWHGIQRFDNNMSRFQSYSMLLR